MKRTQDSFEFDRINRYIAIAFSGVYITDQKRANKGS